MLFCFFELAPSIPTSALNFTSFFSIFTFFSLLSTFNYQNANRQTDHITFSVITDRKNNMGVLQKLSRKSGVIVGDDVLELFKYAQEKNFAIPAIVCLLPVVALNDG